MNQWGIDIASMSASHAGAGRLRVPVFQDLRLRVPAGQVMVIVGPSGAGKTTLLNCVAGLHPINTGYVAMAVGSARGAIEHGQGKTLSAQDRRRVGVAFQQSNLWSHMSVLENLTHPQVHLGGASRAQAREWAEHLLERLVLIDHRDKNTQALSGGQKQRVAIARSLCLRPDVVLFDEITANQDPVNVQRVVELMQAYVRDHQACALTVSHDMAFVRRVADSVAFLEAGAIAMQADRETFFGPQAPERVRDFLASTQ